ncbi:hypothetical protein PTTG_26046 [Puccinia triticina 1-1 BBBD Race 1]|uniref:DUF6589 domain-containing protein n=1 Tax=Puccinia triticina (isolate 1-1 / race 1 (BBBD)) TaxID=630390 RepID=A0A180GXD4_PUCT1|nr:hypothetical protein PTTG_26046 [Puccinia triticina 1-1 BBBD Race 1]
MLPPPDRPADLRSEALKVSYICEVMNSLGLTPKQFFLAFVKQDKISIVSRRRFWSNKRWDSTRELLEAIGTMISSHEPGETNWSGFILGQAQNILKVDKKRENPHGTYYSSKKIKADFFCKENRARRDEQLTNEEHPFLYKLLKSKLLHQSALPDEDLADEDDEKDDTDSLRGPFDEPANLDKDAKAAGKIHRAHVISKTICSMIAFTSNRRKNGMQLENAITFLACGVSDWVNKYLNFIGLSSSCATAHSALRTLGKKAEQTIKNRMKLGPASSPKFCPLICIDNLDFQEAVHVKSVDNQSTMFHGTWGYLHHPNPKLLASVDPKDSTLEAYRTAIANSANEIIPPAKFVLNRDESSHYRSVLKSQVASVFMTYIAETKDKTPTIPLKPPPIEVLDAQKPDITMLKLMIASDNSSESVGEVLEGLARQSGLTPAQFASRLMILEGDLGTCLNLSSLQAQQKPNNRPEESLANNFTLLGGAHTLWNVAQALIALHFGNSLDSKDLGCWHFLEALGVKSNQVLNKKDFSLMLIQIQKIDYGEADGLFPERKASDESKGYK